LLDWIPIHHPWCVAYVYNSYSIYRYNFKPFVPSQTHAKVDVPEDASAKGNCDEFSQTTRRSLGYQNNPETQSRLAFQFVLNTAAAQGGIWGPISPNNYALEDVTGSPIISASTKPWVSERVRKRWEN